MGVVMEAEMGTPFRTAWSRETIETSIVFMDDIPSGKLTSILSWLMVSWFITPISLWFMGSVSLVKGVYEPTNITGREPPWNNIS